ncbi:hypothetical protein TH66_20545 [Carbonactinospora thermoautotrophica]|uniref:Uncharacterized protein n=1 Tax=Carbonactinospora thermoautotrophica TaxID=1469144 RepID=A0A132MKB0_9ACTN|nr:hypothetical protein TH66_20545 [Carbonactinospora thermoautotrophica]KWX09315.1 hypothetical protein TR74_10325 [Carbonactinospora thermoautotrophica]
MSFYGDPDELDRLAQRLVARAAEVRAHADKLSRRAQAVQWQSISADLFRETIARDRQRLERAADQLEQAAAELRAHAQEVRERLAAIRRIEEAVTGWFERTARAIAETASRLIEEGRVVEPPWMRWPWSPQNLPPSGDKQWLEVGEFFRKQGVL